MGGFCRSTDQLDNILPQTKFEDETITIEGNFLNPKVRSIITILKKAKLKYRDEEEMGVFSKVEVDPTVII